MLHLQSLCTDHGLLSAGCSEPAGSPALCLLRKTGSILLCASQLLERKRINFKHTAKRCLHSVHFGHDGLWDQGEITV